MKRILIAVALLLGVCPAQAQMGVAASDKIIMYGVDYSRVKTIGVTESESALVEAFVGINELLLSQPEKYDCSPLVRKPLTVDIGPMCRRIRHADYSAMKLYRQDSDCLLDVAEIVADYLLPDTEGHGMVFIAELLDKGYRSAIYHVVEFDIATREVISDWKVETPAGGFGLRNYWANTVYQIICKARQ